MTPRTSPRGELRPHVVINTYRTTNSTLTRLSIFSLIFALIFSSVGVAPVHARATAPANNPNEGNHDKFADAKDLGSSTSGSTSISSSEARLEEGEPRSRYFDNGGRSVWAKWTAPTSGKYVFDTRNDTIGSDDCREEGNGYYECNFGQYVYETDTTLVVYQGTSLSDLTEVAANDNTNNRTNGVRGQSLVGFIATAGTTYYFQLDTVQDDIYANLFALNWQARQHLPYDDFNDAMDLRSDLSGSVSGINNADATAESGEPQHDDNTQTPNRSMWFKWVAPEDVSVRFSSQASDFETELGVYVGNSVSELTEAPYDSSVEEVAIFNAVAGTTYYLAVDNDDRDESGNISLTWSVSDAARPANDNFVSAQILNTTNAFGEQGTTKYATRESDEPLHANVNGNASVWYKWTASSDGGVYFAVAAENFNPLLAVYTGTRLDALTPVAAHHAAPATVARTGFYATANTTYYIAVDGRSDTRPQPYGAFTLKHDYDTIAPTANATLATPTASGYYTNEAGINITASDNQNGAGIQSITYTVTTDGTAAAPQTVNSEATQVVITAEGTTVVEYSATDIAGNTSSPQSITVKLDRTAPTTTATANGDTDSEGFTRADSVTLNATDAFEVASLTYRVNDGEATTVNGNTATLPINEGTTVINYFATDRAGNVETGKTSTYKADRTAPVSTATANGATDANGYTRASSVTIAATDANGIAALTYSINGGEATTVNSDTATVQLGEGTTTISFFAKDKAGNVETSKTAAYKVDGIAPTTTATANGDTDANGYTHADTVTLNATDADGVASITYRVNGNQAVTINATSTAIQLSEGATAIEFFATDNAGNIEQSKTVSYNVDRTAPVTTATANGDTDANGYSTATSVTLNATDETQVAALTYKINNGQAVTVNGSTTTLTLEEGTTMLTFYATDDAGNREADNNISYKIDRTAPASTSTANGDTDANGYTQATSVTITSTDAFEVAALTYRVNGGEATTVNGSTATVALNEGTTTLAFFATDKAGNIEDGKTAAYKVDRTAPVSNATANGATDANGYTQATSVSINATDANGVASVTYRVNSNQPVTVSGETVNVQLGEGTTTLAFFATDNAGNTETAKSAIYKVDRTAPSATTATANSSPHSSGYYNGANGGVRVTFNATDAGSGIAGYNVSSNGGQPQFIAAANPTLNLPDGITTLTYQAVDNVGNQGATSSSRYQVDATAPVTAYTVASQGKNITLTVNFSDNLSGYAAVTSSLNGGAEQTYRFNTPTRNGTVSYTFNGPYNERGTYTLRYYGTDAAGNREAAKEVTFTIPPQAITPFVTSVVRNSNGTYTATFGYQNDNFVTFNIAAGASNYFSPSPSVRNQTTAFQTGRVTNAFAVTWNGSSLTWTLKGPDGRTRSVRAR